ncbi:DUF2235 domain-containing protein [Paenirhodobacter sp.]|jgi:uncharacterized protein (DUF2235 family)|uniref:DUF2235 domain-containing protein n=1 Tax=Paenirhodobacter sp. TaxID=1965326 RepID=UPI003B50CEAC
MHGVFEKLIAAWRGSRHLPEAAPPVRRQRGPVDHVILLDGTLGSLTPGGMTSIGLIYEFLRLHVPRGSHYYGAGLQFQEWRDLHDLWFGWGVNAQIERAYGWLATRYRPGDRIYLIGYSRGAFAARSLAGMIERVGLLRTMHATERNVTLAWRHYEAGGAAVPAFRERFCHAAVPIRMVGAFDTVRALGFQFPLIWMLSEPRYRFHDHKLGRSVEHGFHALALQETRSKFEPLLWDSRGTGAGRIQQVWFRGTHGDLGGQLGAHEEARPLANVPLVWMLGAAQSVGLRLPEGWRTAFPCNPHGPSIGSWSGFGKFFLARAPRVIGRDPSESIDPGAVAHGLEWWLTIRPRLAARAARMLRRSVRPAHEETGGGSEGIDTAIGGAADLAAGDTR